MSDGVTIALITVLGTGVMSLLAAWVTGIPGQLKELRERIDDLEDRNDKLRKERDTLQARVFELEREVAELKEKMPAGPRRPAPRDDRYEW